MGIPSDVVRGAKQSLARRWSVAIYDHSTAPVDAEHVTKIRDGVIRNISVGYRILQTVATAATATALAVLRVTEWEPIEISAVPIPADPGAQVRLF